MEVVSSIKMKDDFEDVSKVWGLWNGDKKGLTELSHRLRQPFTSNVSLTCQQEVSAFGDEGEGDHLDEWTVQCGGLVWQREEAVRFRHKATEALLSVTGEQYGRPIHGQREVHAMSSPSQHSLWKTMEGIFMKPSESAAGGQHYSHPHPEL